MVVRAKFKLISQKNSEGWKKDKEGKTALVASYEFTPVYSDDPESENKKFWEATPSGKITLDTVNPEVLKEFDIGREYYIDFIPVESPEEKARRERLGIHDAPHQ